MPVAAPASVAGAELISHCNGIDCYVDVTTGSGTFCLAQYGPGDKWRQYGPSWTADTTIAGHQPGRIAIPSEPPFYYTIVRLSGTPDVGAAYMAGVHRGG